MQKHVKILGVTKFSVCILGKICNLSKLPNLERSRLISTLGKSKLFGNMDSKTPTLT